VDERPAASRQPCGGWAGPSFTARARSEAQCIATYSLRGGQITGWALINLSSLAPYAVAITGGSGKYQGAEGEVRVQPVSDTRGILTFHLKD
jgi:hypothetical protein